VANERIAVEVACAMPDRQTVIALEVAEGCTAGQALEESGIFALYPELERAACAVGIFGREVTPGRRLQSGDRVEVLRPLAEDPRERRRRLARESRAPRGRSARRG
jgi:putative ubiquitin-RnfH superfamily antitoxin RatB of RatAB toxin-antitoxin module